MIGAEAQGEKNCSWCTQTRLEIVEMGNPVLRQPARELSKEEILSPEIQQLIEMMKVTMGGTGVGLAAPQIGCPLQIAVIEDRAEYHKALSPEILKERERVPVPLHVIINPKITLDESDMIEFFEGCLSVDNCMGVVSRARSVRVECLNEKAEPIVIEAKGWYARILQHEIDHLRGTLFLDRVNTKSLTSMENFDTYWRNRPIADVRKEISRLP
ncbi:MAG: peptide deformylase [Verrucomicrobia bacterium]|nr:peptide deformylase [Verrucomicrobiota bacterium]